jgi:hypothetical protein
MYTVQIKLSETTHAVQSQISIFIKDDCNEKHKILSVN